MLKFFLSAFLLISIRCQAALIVEAHNNISNWGDDNAFLSVDIYDSNGVWQDTTGPVVSPFRMEFWNLNLPAGLLYFGYEADTSPGGRSPVIVPFIWDGVSVAQVIISGDWNDVPFFESWITTVHSIAADPTPSDDPPKQ